MAENENITFEPFTDADFDRLISWIKNEKELVQFAGPVFNFPLTRAQLHNYLIDPKRHAFKIIHVDTHTVIGHCEAYQEDEQHSRLCRILIGDKSFRGKGYGTVLTKMLTEWIFENLQAEYITLNVYDFNAAAIKSYEKAGFVITAVNENKIQVCDEMWTSYKMRVDRENFYNITKQKPTNIE